MSRFRSALGSLTVAELSLPGTHDSGSYDMASAWGRPLTQTQSLSLFDQLRAGVRALDLRVGVQPDKRGHDRFVLTHGSWKTRVTVSCALSQLEAFLRRHPDELIVVDVHRIRHLRGEPESRAAAGELQARVCEQIGHRLIRPGEQELPLEVLWRDRGRRIVVAMNDPERDERHFWPGVDQHWYNTHSVPILKEKIAADLARPRPAGLWSICAVMTPQPDLSIVRDWLTGLPSIAPSIDSWFQINEWTAGANIISVDWFAQTGLARACASTNILKGAIKAGECSRL